MELTERKLKILQAIISDYVKSQSLLVREPFQKI